MGLDILQVKIWKNLFNSETFKDTNILPATIPDLYNLLLAVADTEYSFSIGNCKKFTFKARDGSVKLSPYQNQSNLVYGLLVDGQSYSEDNIKLTNKTYYFQSPTDNTTVEIFIWQ